MRRRDEFALVLAMSACVMPLALPVVLGDAIASVSAGARREPTDREVDRAFARIVRGLERNGGRRRW